MTRSERPRRPSSMPLRLRSPAEEATRDMAESAFTNILRAFWLANAGVLAVAFVDSEGECVDYCSSLPPFDAKVAAAHLRVVVDDVRRFAERRASGEPSHLEIHGRERDLVARSLGDDYLLVVVLAAGETDQAVLHDLEETVVRLRREAGIGVPSWDPSAELTVEVRTAIGWPFAPRAFVEGGRRHEVASVLGRWEEVGAVDVLDCFRVQTARDEELTLAYDRAERRWLRW
ncbi:MAG: hypothetical protein KF901_20825 [Myxococcales bacterium]|nr:hypothetical protein [Myxococcales bacterium]